MIATVHQALFGEHNRGHGLLASSLSESVMRSLLLVTDLPGSAIPPNLQWEPYVRGYVAGNYYVLSKTFPDQNAVRPGMVFTHVLLIDRLDILQINHLDEIFQLLPEKIHRSSSISSLQVNIATSLPPKGTPAGYSKVVHTLLTNPQSTVIWVGNKGFTEIVQTLWANLWPSAREKFTFRISFAPQDIHDNPPTIVCVPESLASRWNRDQLVRITDEYQPNPSDEMYLAEAFLIGLPDAKPLRQFQYELDAFLPELTTLRLLGRSFNHMQEIDIGKNNIDHVRDLVRALRVLAPSPDNGLSIKEKVITRLRALTAQGTANDIKAVRNMILTPFPTATTFFAETVKAWMHHRLMVESERDPASVAELVGVAIADFSTDWATNLRSNLTTILESWDDQTARIVWRWWDKRSDLVHQLDNYIPEKASVEQSLANQCARNLPAQLGEAVLGFARKRNWLSLYGVACLSLYPPLIAIKKHLEVDRSPSFEVALRQLNKRLDAKTILEAALDIGENRLLRLAGEICAKEPSFLAELDLDSREWRVIWYESLLISKDPWKGIDEPSAMMNAVLRRVLEKQSIENSLLERLGETTYGDLTEHPERPNVTPSCTPCPKLPSRSGVTAVDAPNAIVSSRITPKRTG